ncbi:hypothetical protein E3N88_12292 [Mikania micrantha]|uniref:Uncharacterized protein n=1 Tax=Mikania micrantha TaxID=192012 RepID=A0A5N6P744_9ASTR|nr:hypothetical protein E3N88_12292 [Mikania micrantha]
MELRNSKVESSTFDQSQPIQKTDGDGSKILADVGNAGGGGEVMKRKRGRPPRVQANQPVAKKSKEEDEDEDVCFICFDGGRGVQRHTILLVSSGTKHFFDQKLNGTVVGIFVACVRRQHTICAILVPTHCAKDALESQIMCV